MVCLAYLGPRLRVYLPHFRHCESQIDTSHDLSYCLCQEPPAISQIVLFGVVSWPWWSSWWSWFGWKLEVAVSWTEMRLVAGSSERRLQDRLPQMSHKANRTHFMAPAGSIRAMEDCSPGGEKKVGSCRRAEALLIGAKAESESRCRYKRVTETDIGKIEEAYRREMRDRRPKTEDTYEK